MNLKNNLHAILRSFISETLLQKQLYFFRKGMLLLCLSQLIYYSYYSSFFFSASFVPPKPVSGYGLHTFLHLLSHPIFKDSAFMFLVGGFFSIFLLAINKFTHLCSFLLWFTISNLHHRVYFSLTGGDVLAEQLLFLLIFVSNKKQPAYFEKILHNTASLGLILQVVFVYLFSAWYKWLDPSWLSGEAIGFVAQLPAYSNYVGSWILSFPLVYIPLTYSILIFQTLFPLFIFFRRTKLLWIWIGIFIHLGIAVFMVLYFFSSIMIICYLLFTESKKV